MTRLDVWLVENNHFSSRQLAKRAIKQGLVTVDGEKAKPSKRLSGKEAVEISPDAKDYPEGYFKLKKLELSFSVLNFDEGMEALDIGSSAGGFLHYLKDKGVIATGIEVSGQFADILIPIVEKNENLSLIVGDAFELKPETVFEENQFDILLVDVTTDVKGTLELIGSYSPILKTDGMLIAAFKCGTAAKDQEYVLKQTKDIGFQGLNAIVLDQSTQEVHVIGIRQ